MKVAKIPRRRGLELAPPGPLPDDVRERPRQLTLGDSGAVEQLAPPLDAAVAVALQVARGPSYCVRVWCDAPATTGGHECDTHGAETAEQLHHAIRRIARAPRKSRKVPR